MASLYVTVTNASVVFHVTRHAQDMVTVPTTERVIVDLKAGEEGYVNVKDARDGCRTVLGTAHVSRHSVSAIAIQDGQERDVKYLNVQEEEIATDMVFAMESTMTHHNVFHAI